MREILFRGKSDSGEWVEGCHYTYLRDDNKQKMHCILQDIRTLATDFKINYVDSATIGQFTGLRDKNGTPIYEGDIVTYPDGDGGYEYCDEIISSGVVTWGDESALFYITNNYSAEFPDIWDRVDEMEIIGNIHDTPKGE